MGIPVSTTTKPVKKINKADQKTYETLRLLLGGLAVLFPLFLIVGNFINLGEIKFQGSMSAYYYTDMQDVFVGTMAAMGVFLIAYIGYDTKIDNRVGNLAGLSAIVTALVPTAPSGADLVWTNWVHLIAAFTFFMCLAYYCLVLFRRTEAAIEQQKPIEGNLLVKVWQHLPKEITFVNPDANTQKIKRNTIYKICGRVILFSLALLFVLVGVDSWLLDLDHLYYTLILESIATVSFGFSWLVKSQSFSKRKNFTLWRD